MDVSVSAPAFGLRPERHLGRRLHCGVHICARRSRPRSHGLREADSGREERPAVHPLGGESSASTYMDGESSGQGTQRVP